MWREAGLGVLLVPGGDKGLYGRLDMVIGNKENIKTFKASMLFLKLDISILRSAPGHPLASEVAVREPSTVHRHPCCPLPGHPQGGARPPLSLGPGQARLD